MGKKGLSKRKDLPYLKTKDEAKKEIEARKTSGNINLSPVMNNQAAFKDTLDSMIAKAAKKHQSEPKQNGQIMSCVNKEQLDSNKKLHEVFESVIPLSNNPMLYSDYDKDDENSKTVFETFERQLDVCLDQTTRQIKMRISPFVESYNTNEKAKNKLVDTSIMMMAYVYTTFASVSSLQKKPEILKYANRDIYHEKKALFIPSTFYMGMNDQNYLDYDKHKKFHKFMEKTREYIGTDKLKETLKQFNEDHPGVMSEAGIKNPEHMEIKDLLRFAEYKELRELTYLLEMQAIIRQTIIDTTIKYLIRSTYLTLMNSQNKTLSVRNITLRNHLPKTTDEWTEMVCTIITNAIRNLYIFYLEKKKGESNPRILKSLNRQIEQLETKIDEQVNQLNDIEDYKELSETNETLQHEIDSQKETNKKLTEEIKELKKELQKNKSSNLSKQIKELTKQSENLKEEYEYRIKHLEEELNNLNNEDTQYTSIDKDSIRILFLYDKQEYPLTFSRIQEYFPQSKITNKLNNAVAMNTDMYVCLTKYTSHGFYYRIKDKADALGIPFRHVYNDDPKLIHKTLERSILYAQT